MSAFACRLHRGGKQLHPHSILFIFSSSDDHEHDSVGGDAGCEPAFTWVIKENQTWRRHNSTGQKWITEKLPLKRLLKWTKECKEIFFLLFAVLSGGGLRHGPAGRVFVTVTDKQG